MIFTSIDQKVLSIFHRSKASMMPIMLILSNLTYYQYVSESKEKNEFDSI